MRILKKTRALGQCLSAQTVVADARRAEYILVLRMRGNMPSNSELKGCTGLTTRIETTQEVDR